MNTLTSIHLDEKDVSNVKVGTTGNIPYLSVSHTRLLLFFRDRKTLDTIIDALETLRLEVEWKT